MILKYILCIYLIFQCVRCGKPSLSDPLGLNDQYGSNFKFESRGGSYVLGSIWPKPQQESREDEYFALDASKFDFKIAGKTADVLEEAVIRYRGLVFPDQGAKGDENLNMITSLEIHVEYDYEPLSVESDESYTLIIEAPTAVLSSYTVWGALRGLETFSQAVHQNETEHYLAQKNKIVDYPRFHHRGFLIDTSRHYVHLEVIYKFLDAMAYSKFNVFHWHIVDDQSFPFVSQVYPTLHGQGAFNNKTHIYSPDDVKNVIDYARYRGIRVLPEFDTPGHTQSWFSIPDLLTPCYNGDKPNGNFGPVNPTIEKNYEFLREFFREVSMVFPDKYVHMGGDEVDFSCWKSNPNIAKWMNDNGMGKNYSKLEQYYEQRLLDIVGNLGRGYVIWQEVVDNQVKVQSNTIVNIWKGHGDQWKAEASRITKKGYSVILSSPWYLNYISYAQDWHPYYDCDPQSFDGTTEEKEMVIGGTACMWGEWVDATNLLSRTWARGLSVGERLWSAADVRDLQDATKRIWEHRCRYLRRGIPAENVVQSKYCLHEWRPSRN